MFYNRNNTVSSLGAFTENSVEAREGYVGEAGVAQIMIESVQNDYKLFESLIEMDFQEAAAVVNPSVVSESVLQGIYEASGVGFIEKVKSYLKNAWEKIKGLFKSFWDILQKVVIRDNEKLVKKFKNQVGRKDLSKMKCKYAKKSAKHDELFAKMNTEFTTSEETDKYVDEAFAAIRSGKDYTTAELDKMAEQLKEDGLDARYSQVLPNTTSAEFRKDLHEALWDEEDDQEGFSTAEIAEIEALLSGSGKEIKELKKKEKETNAAFAKRLNKIDALRKEIEKIPFYKDGDDKGTDELKKGNDNNKFARKDVGAGLTKAVNVVYDGAKIDSSVASNVIGALIAETKFGIKQARKVYSRAISFNPKAVKESALLDRAIEEAAEYHVDEMFEYGAWA